MNAETHESLLSTEPSQLRGIYNMPGEGFIVELAQGERSLLYDRRGLQFRIQRRKQAGLDTECEELALHQINSFGPSAD